LLSAKGLSNASLSFSIFGIFSPWKGTRGYSWQRCAPAIATACASADVIASASAIANAHALANANAIAPPTGQDGECPGWGNSPG
jgi:hypothetical protein